NTIRNRINHNVVLPGSKSITLRNLVLASLAEGTTEIDGPCDCDDTREMVECLGELGIDIQASDDYRRLKVEGRGGRFAEGPVILKLGLSGTSARFLIALSALRTDETRLAGRGSLNERPNSPLLDALEQMGGETKSSHGGCLPVSIRGPGTSSSTVRMKGDVSSQFFSALLQIAPVLPDGLEIQVEGELVSRPYIDITLNEMRTFGVDVENDNYRLFRVAPQQYRSGPRSVEGDASAGSYFAALALIHGGKVVIANLGSESRQGDIRFLSICESLGAHVQMDEKKTVVEGPEDGCVRPAMGELDCGDIPDAALTLIALSPLIPGTTRITGIGTLKQKECDRIDCPAAELRKIGVAVKTGPDFIEVGELPPGALNATEDADIETYRDHRMAMSFAVLGTRLGNLNILDPEVVGKTYPRFWEDLARIR
ncbi:MAG: 3-phosphoshikimate 1-carboxyvinyltransferase, partial [Gemmatimonadetes bacterium]|nr:3-phosphoshikimate 1-carboxyvinyltransferase [Gemmatimonadota bacterium]